MKTSKKWKEILDKLFDLIKHKKFEEAIKVYEDAITGEYIPQSDADLLEKVYNEVKILKHEYDQMTRYQKMERPALLRAIFIKNKIDLEALLEYTKKYKIDKKDIVYFEKFTLSPVIENKEKIFFLNIISEVEPEFDIKVYNKNLNKFFNWKGYTKLYFKELGKIINDRLIKSPSDFPSAATVLGNIEEYYLGFFPMIDQKILADDIINYVHGMETSKDGANIIVRSMINEEISD